VILPNIRSRIFLMVFAVCCLPACSLLLAGCDYARMTDDEAIDTHEKTMPAMPAHTVPVGGGIEQLHTIAPGSLTNTQSADPASIVRGQEAYGFYCIHCHGPEGNGYGTVGQSFAPLPADLSSPAVQQQSDGELFVKISLGYKRCPPLAYTVAEKDRWAVINYLRSLAKSRMESP
jgi:mono/diheme cytochrome c family protein